MHGEPFNRRHQEGLSKSLVTLLLSAFGINNIWIAQAGVTVIVALIEIMSVGAKLITRKKAGIRAVGRLRMVGHLSIGFIIPYSIVHANTTFHQIIIMPKFAYFFGYLGFLVITWLTNMLIFTKDKPKHTRYRGYGIYEVLGKNTKHSEKKLLWLRLLDPIFALVITWSLYQMLGEDFIIISWFLGVSAIILFIEESAYIYGMYNFEMDKKDAASMSEGEAKDFSNPGY